MGAVLSREEGRVVGIYRGHGSQRMLLISSVTKSNEETKQKNNAQVCRWHVLRCGRETLPQTVLMEAWAVY